MVDLYISSLVWFGGVSFWGRQPVFGFEVRLKRFDGLSPSRCRGLVLRSSWYSFCIDETTALIDGRSHGLGLLVCRFCSAESVLAGSSCLPTGGGDQLGRSRLRAGRGSALSRS